MYRGIDVPEGFSITQKGRYAFLTKKRYEHALSGQTLMDSSAGIPAEGQDVFHGRETTRAIPVPTLGGKRLIKRHYRHGGLWGMFARDILWGCNRPLNELATSEKASEQGVETAEVVALRFENVFGPLFRADIFTFEISDTEDLIVFLSSHSVEQITARKKVLINRIAQSVRKMHDAGIYHADLHLKNILVKMDDPPGVYIIDLDKSDFCANAAGGGLPPGRRMDNLLRLDRSLVKLQTQTLIPALRCITMTDRLRFLREYLKECHLNNASDWKSLLRHHATHHSGHRLWWGILRAAGMSIYGFKTK